MEAIRYVIDCDAAPSAREDWKVKVHKKAGQIEWDPGRVRLYLSYYQKDSRTVGGHALRDELEGVNTLNANALDFLLAHPECIPEAWEREGGENIFFWGTIYSVSSGGEDVEIVRCFFFDRTGRACGGHYIVDSDFDNRDPAALLAF